MDHSHSTIASHIKGKHLSYEERVLIQIRLKDHYSIRAIAREISCSPSTVSNEIARGSVALYNGHVIRYTRRLPVRKPMRTTESTVAGIITS